MSKTDLMERQERWVEWALKFGHDSLAEDLRAHVMWTENLEAANDEQVARVQAAEGARAVRAEEIKKLRAERDEAKDLAKRLSREVDALKDRAQRAEADAHVWKERAYDENEANGPEVARVREEMKDLKARYADCYGAEYVASLRREVTELKAEIKKTDEEAEVEVEHLTMRLGEAAQILGRTQWSWDNCENLLEQAREELAESRKQHKATLEKHDVLQERFTRVWNRWLRATRRTTR